jgi:opacity protein-like surface antigen
MFHFKSILTLLFLYFASSALFAQDSTSLAGKYALQFQISQNFTLSNFLGSVISGKYHFTNNSAIRLGVTFSSSMDNDGQNIDYQNSTNSASYMAEQNGKSFDITAQYLVYPEVNKKILFYWGAGPRVAYTYSNNKTNHSSTGSPDNYITAKTNSWTVGVLGSAGVEWFFTSQMSILAEYGLSYVYSYSKREKTEGVNDRITDKNHNYSFGASIVRFGLSVYF